MSPITDHEFWIDTFIFYISDFIQKRFWVHNNTIANNRHGFAIDNSGRNEMKFKSNTINDNGVTGVVTAVKSDNVVGFSGKEIGNLSFAFVAPLGADNDSDVRRIGRHFVPGLGLAGLRLMSLKKKYGWKVYN